MCVYCLSPGSYSFAQHAVAIGTLLPSLILNTISLLQNVTLAVYNPLWGHLPPTWRVRQSVYQLVFPRSPFLQWFRILTERYRHLCLQSFLKPSGFVLVLDRNRLHVQFILHNISFIVVFIACIDLVTAFLSLVASTLLFRILLSWRMGLLVKESVDGDRLFQWIPLVSSLEMSFHVCVLFHCVFGYTSESDHRMYHPILLLMTLLHLLVYEFFVIRIDPTSCLSRNPLLLETS